MDLGLTGQVALVTAASRGLGAAVARRFALEGARVALCARDLDHARATAQSIAQETGAEVVGFKADVAVPADVDALTQHTLEHFGRIDSLIVNAGGPPAGTFETLKPEQWEQATQLTLMSAVRLCYAVIPHMKKQGSGSIVFITAFLVRQPTRNLTLSNTIRMATIGLMKTLSQEMAPFGIRSNAVAPGWTATERVAEIMQSRAQAGGTTPGKSQGQRRSRKRPKSLPRSPWAGWARRKSLPTRRCSSLRRLPHTSLASRWRLTAA